MRAGAEKKGEHFLQVKISGYGNVYWMTGLTCREVGHSIVCNHPRSLERKKKYSGYKYIQTYTNTNKHTDAEIQMAVEPVMLLMVPP